MCLDLQRCPPIGGPAQNSWDLCRFERLGLACSSPVLRPPWPMDRARETFGCATATATWAKYACWVWHRNRRRSHLAMAFATRGSCASLEFQRAPKGEILNTKLQFFKRFVKKVAWKLSSVNRWKYWSENLSKNSLKYKQSSCVFSQLNYFSNDTWQLKVSSNYVRTI